MKLITGRWANKGWAVSVLENRERCLLNTSYILVRRRADQVGASLRENKAFPKRVSNLSTSRCRLAFTSLHRSWEPGSYTVSVIYLTHGLSEELGYQLAHMKAMRPVQVCAYPLIKLVTRPIISCSF